jgi:exosortase E/protease (VPEID-CTERM system)
MQQVSFGDTSSRGYRPGWAVRLGVLYALFIAEKIFLNTFVDFEHAAVAPGVGAVVRVVQHWGLRFLVAFIPAIGIFAYVRGSKQFAAISVAVREAPLRLGWMLWHLLFVAILAGLSFLLYRYTPSELSIAAVAALGVLAGIAALTSAALAAAPASLWVSASRAVGVIWWYAALAAVLGTGAMQLSQRLWEPTAVFTFDLVRHLLSPLLPTLRADPSTMVLGTDRFAVQIAEVCSGLEGVGLMLAFSCSWLLCFRKEYIFPRALLLIPVSLLAIFALNSFRIAALILIGNAGFEDVAVYGFHSQAGWIAFIAVACGLVLLSRRSTWLNRVALADEAVVTHNPTAVYLMPLLAILAAGALSHAMSSDFEFFYPLRIVAGVGLLFRYRKELAALDWRWSWRGPALGVLVFAAWMVGAHFLLPEHAMPDKLAAMSPSLRGLWILSRIAGSVLIVPIAEELAYRGYLMRRLTRADFESLPFRAVRWPALTVAAVVFGIAHGALWLPGIAAGLAYGLILVRRGHLGEAVAAHATTNALVVIGVLAGQQWQLW